MSRIGNAIIKITDKVKVQIQGQKINVEGPKGKLSYEVHPSITFTLEDNVLAFKRASESNQDKALHGTSRAVIANLFHGVTEGFSKTLEINGVGYRGEQKGKGINFLLGYSHPIFFEPPEGIDIKMEGNTKVHISGIEKQKVGQVAANIREFRPPEPYKGKGIKYSDEQIRRKEVKKS